MTDADPADPAPSGPCLSPDSPRDSGEDTPRGAEPPDPGLPDSHSSPEGAVTEEPRTGDGLDTAGPPAHATDRRCVVSGYDGASVEGGTAPAPEEPAQPPSPPGPPLEALHGGERQGGSPAHATDQRRAVASYDGASVEGGTAPAPEEPAQPPSPPGIGQCGAGCEGDPGAQGPQPTPDSRCSSEGVVTEEWQIEGELSGPTGQATDRRRAVCGCEDVLAEGAAAPAPEEPAEPLSPPGPPLEALYRAEPLSVPPTSQGAPPGANDLPQPLLGPPAPTVEADQSSEEGTKLHGHDSPHSSVPAQDEGQGCGPEQGAERPSRAGPGSLAPSDSEGVWGRRKFRVTRTDVELASPGGGELEQHPAFRSPSPLPVPLRVSLAHNLSPKLLDSGLAALPGTRAFQGQVVLLICTQNVAWLGPHCGVQEFTDLFLYLHSIPRPEDQARGLTVLVDARRCSFNPRLFQGLLQMQNIVPGSVHRVLLLGKMSGAPPAGLKVEMLLSVRALLSFIPNSQLPINLGGRLHYNHDAWLGFRKRLETLQESYLEAHTLLCRAVQSLKGVTVPGGLGRLKQLPRDPQEMVQHVLAHPMLVWLQQEGGRALAEFQREEPGGIQSSDHRLAVEEVGKLYAQAVGMLHRLVTLYNQRIRTLELGKMLKAQAKPLAEIQTWLQNVGWPALKVPKDPSLRMLLQAQDSFFRLYRASQKFLCRGEEIMAGWEVAELGHLGVPGAHLMSLHAQLSDFSKALAWRRQQLKDAQQLSEMLDQAREWTQAGRRTLAKLAEDKNASAAMVLRSLEEHQALHPDLAPSYFQQMEVLAAGLDSNLTVHQCHLLRVLCKDTQQMLDRKLEKARKSKWSLASFIRGRWHGGVGASSSDQASLASGGQAEGGAGGSRAPVGSTTFRGPWEAHASGAWPKQRLQNLACRLSLDEPSTSALAAPPGPSGSVLEAVGSQRAEPPILRPLVAPRPTLCSPLLKDITPDRLHFILGELLSTERDYVRALDYVVENYMPELERDDAPRALRGQQARIFGNLEKLRDFHRHVFLRELESCSQQPIWVAHTFLRHSEEFGMYAFYSKNKPRSDMLMASHGRAFLKDKQRCLGDRLDLSSYLLKPIQRISKYVLLLQELYWACKEKPPPHCFREPDLAALRCACSLLRFHLRHGNNLLAMDAICGCDVNLQEQGQLVRQDRFTVWSGRKKCQRHLFLFEELLLFSKSQQGAKGGEVFFYKHSLKTADIGFTESHGESGLCFEIWFRRRHHKASNTFVLQALTPQIKQAWTADIAHLLWRQATRNKELRMAEMASMGVGSKPFLDITPSAAASGDLAIHYIVKGRGAAGVSLFDHTNPNPGSSATFPPGPSSSSLLEPLDLHLCGDPTPMELCWPSHPTAYLVESEAEAETAGQPSPTPEGAEASSRCRSASSESGPLDSDSDDLSMPPLEASSDSEHCERIF